MSSEDANIAFEYVAGTLTAEERREFENRMTDNPELTREVAFWEQHLMAIQPDEARAPQSDTWQRIETAITPNATQQTETTGFSWSTLWQWASPTVAAMVLLFAVIGYNPMQTTAPNTDYIAVLTDTTGKARLTALTTADDKRMWLKWESDYAINPETNVQLWAISKRDGQTRPLGVFSSTDVAQVELDQTRWRLVTDAEYLLLTEEEEGGSAIDEPSEVILAKGFCVRFSSAERDS
ncbi:hypothetical protein TDB9533_03671 [Thalassocella blandensis]|nr:hypothetical protein TDB9533_03671 [Thalassocella blandensis]